MGGGVKGAAQAHSSNVNGGYESDGYDSDGFEHVPAGGAHPHLERKANEPPAGREFQAGSSLSRTINQVVDEASVKFGRMWRNFNPTPDQKRLAGIALGVFIALQSLEYVLLGALTHLAIKMYPKQYESLVNKVKELVAKLNWNEQSLPAKVLMIGGGLIVANVFLSFTAMAAIGLGANAEAVFGKGAAPAARPGLGLSA